MKFNFHVILCGCLFLVCSLYSMQQQISNPFNITQIPEYSPLRCFFPIKGYKGALIMAYYVLLPASLVGLEASTSYLDPSVGDAIMLDRTMNKTPVPFNELMRVAFDYNKWFEDFTYYIKTRIKKTN
jgi:hypothetical protein